MKRIRKVGTIAFLVCSIGIFSVLFWRERKTEKQQEENYLVLQGQVRILERERNRIKSELGRLKTEYDEEFRGMGSAVVLFTDLNENIYRDMFPKMKKAGYVGVMALPVDRFCDQKNGMNKEQIGELIDEGWKCCFKWQKDKEPEEWLEEGAAISKELGIARPDAVYFPYGTYEGGIDDFLSKKGIKTAIHHGEEKQSLVAIDLDKEIWHPGAVGLKGNDVYQLFLEAIDHNGNIIFTIGSDSPDEQYSQEDFDAMLEFFFRYGDIGELMVTDLQGAWEYHKGLADSKASSLKPYGEKKKELEKELETVNKEMESLLGNSVENMN